MKTLNQHYIPQSYINRLVDKERLSVYFKNERKILNNQSSRNYAAERCYYDTTKEKIEKLLEEQKALFPNTTFNFDDDQFIEHMLGRAESDMKHVLDSIYETPILLQDDSIKTKVILFLHDIAYRGREYRNSLESINKITYDAIQKMTIPNKEKIMEEEYGPEAGKTKQLYTLLGVQPLLETFNRLFENYDFFWATAENDAEFVISDDVLASLRHGYPEIVFPVSAQNAIILRERGINAPIMGTDCPKGIFLSVSIANVVRYNVLQYSFADRYVFGKQKIIELMSLVWETGTKGVYK